MSPGGQAGAPSARAEPPTTKAQIWDYYEAMAGVGEGYLRLSYANSEANLRAALERMRPVCARLASGG